MFPTTVNSMACSTQINMDKQHIFYFCNISCIVTSFELKLYNEEQLQCLFHHPAFHTVQHIRD